jgi:hypothetical protein
LNDIVEILDFIFECLNLNLVTGCGLRKLLIFMDLIFEFLVEFENGMPELINDNFFLVEKFQINDFRDFHFHRLVVLRNNFVITRLQTVFEGIKRHTGIWLKFSRVKYLISLGFDNEGGIFLDEDKIINRMLLAGNFLRSSFH